MKLRGIPASAGRRTGIARVLMSAGEFTKIRSGEILVTRFATPDVVLVFDRIVGLVTDQGGRSAHAAVVARELGIPTVVGVQNATEMIADESTILIDGTDGTVEVLVGADD